LTIFSYVDTLAADQCRCTFYWCDSWFVEWPSRAWPQALLICLPSIVWPLPLLMRLLSNVQLLFLFMHLPSSTYFQAPPLSSIGPSPFKEILMALRQIKKTRHRNNYTLLPVQTLKTVKLILSSYCETMHVWKKSTWQNLELHQNWCIFEFCLVFFFLCQLLTLCFWWSLVFSTNTSYSPWLFWTLWITLFTGHGIKGKTLSYIFVDSSFVYVWVCKYIFAYLNFFLKLHFNF